MGAPAATRPQRRGTKHATHAPLRLLPPVAVLGVWGWGWGAAAPDAARTVRADRLCQPRVGPLRAVALRLHLRLRILQAGTGSGGGGGGRQRPSKRGAPHAPAHPAAAAAVQPTTIVPSSYPPP